MIAEVGQECIECIIEPWEISGEGLRLVGRLWPFWYFTGQLAEARSALERYLGVNKPDDPDIYDFTSALMHLAFTYFQQGESEPAIQASDGCIASFRSIGD